MEWLSGHFHPANLISKLNRLRHVAENNTTNLVLAIYLIQSIIFCAYPSYSFIDYKRFNFRFWKKSWRDRPSQDVKLFDLNSHGWNEHGWLWKYIHNLIHLHNFKSKFWTGERTFLDRPKNGPQSHHQEKGHWPSYFCDWDILQFQGICSHNFLFPFGPHHDSRNGD